MAARYFSVEEANALLPEISPLMEQLLERRAEIIATKDTIGELVHHSNSDFGGPAATALVKEFIAIEELVEQIRSFGCVIKDLNNGLIDFLALREGREIYLCWRFGEPRIEFFHELHTGFAGRQRV